MRIRDPDVVFTDLALAILGAYLAWRLARGSGFLTTRGVWLMAGLASAAFWGAVFHAFFPGDTTTTAGFLAWVPVSLSIMVVASVLLALGLRLLVPLMSHGVRRLLTGAYAAAFTAVVLFVDQSYGTIVRFYAPTLILFLVASLWHASRGGGWPWWLLAIGVVISILAAVMQQMRISLHPTYFDHNAVYHVLQGIALVLLYVGFRRVSLADATDRARRRE